MVNKYLCPKCNGQLNVANYIILKIKVKSKSEGLILFETKLGSYKVLKNTTCSFNEGDHVNFFCPLCHENLSITDVNRDLAKVKMIDQTDTEFEIVFSEIAGEHCTYKISDSKVEVFGENSGKYINFFGIEPRY